MMWPVTLMVVSFAAAADATGATTSDRGTALSHPAGWHTVSDVLRIRAQISSGAEPWATAFKTFMNDTSLTLEYKPSPVEVVHRDCECMCCPSLALCMHGPRAHMHPLPSSIAPNPESTRPGFTRPPFWACSDLHLLSSFRSAAGGALLMFATCTRCMHHHVPTPWRRSRITDTLRMATSKPWRPAQPCLLGPAVYLLWPQVCSSFIDARA